MLAILEGGWLTTYSSDRWVWRIIYVDGDVPAEKLLSRSFEVVTYGGLIIYEDGAIVFNGYEIISLGDDVAISLVLGSFCGRRFVIESLGYGSLLAGRDHQAGSLHLAVDMAVWLRGSKGRCWLFPSWDR